MPLHRLIPATHNIKPTTTPLFSTEALRQIEAQAQQKIQSGHDSLMQKAGCAISRLTQACYPHARTILIVAGKGNNGGDALIAAHHLHNMGKQVHILWLGCIEKCNPDTLSVKQALEKTTLPLYSYTAKNVEELFVKNFDLIIDGLFGIGLSISKTLDQHHIELITHINHHPAPVIAIDVPSGLFADTGALHSRTVKANHTITFLAAKPGLFTANGREYCGHIWLDTLETTHFWSSFTPCAYLFSSIRKNNPRQQNTHKGSFGDVAIIGGTSGMKGAALLAARTALRAGTGRVYLSLLQQEQYLTSIDLDFNHPELMFRRIEQLTFSKNTIVCGCGAGQAVERYLQKILSECPRLILDADALNAIAQSNTLQQQLKSRALSGLLTIITPHPLEAARLLDTDTTDIQNNRLDRAQSLANMFNCICVLKGSGTVITSPDESPLINSSGNAALATAGSGDVLAGWIGGRWSSSLHSGDSTLTVQDLQTFVAQCVWEHGHAADMWRKTYQDHALSASELISYL